MIMIRRLSGDIYAVFASDAVAQSARWLAHSKTLARVASVSAVAKRPGVRRPSAAFRVA